MEWTVGQNVCVKRTGNAARGRTGDNIIFDAIITKIGRKYFSIDELKYDRFHIKSGFQDAGNYTANYCVYPSRQAVLDEMEKYRLYAELKEAINKFDVNSISLMDIRQIHELALKLRK